MNTAARIALPVMLIGIVIDQVTKIYMRAWLSDLQPPRVEVLPFLNWTLFYNKGASFSVLSDVDWGRWILTALAFIVVAVLLFSLRESARSRLYGLSVGLITGGALGNVIDRIYIGAVVDFIDFHWNGFHPFIFNIADTAITLGVCCLLFDMFFGQSTRK